MSLNKAYLSFQQNHIKEVIENKFNIKDEDIIDMIHQIWNNKNDIK